MKKLTKLLLTLIVSILILEGSTVSSFASEDLQIIKLVKTETGTSAKEEPKDSAKTVMEFEPGALIAVVEEVNAAWYAVGYQGEVYYVKQADTVETTDAASVEAVDQELEEEYIEGKIMIEEIERQQEEAKKTRVWAVVIIVLVAAIFAVGIVSHLRNSKEEKEEVKAEKK